MIINTSNLYRPQDAVKLAFQAAFGAEHLLKDVDKARAYFDEEYSKSSESAPLVEEIAHEVVRINISAWKEANLPADLLFDLFVFSSTTKNENANQMFLTYLYEFEQLSKKGALLFSYSDWTDFMVGYNTSIKPQPVRHSDEYREKKKPAYRVVSGFYVRLIPILYALRGLPHAVIGIDGRAASGKSLIASGLSGILKTVPISMDDFFLPSELRSEKRLDEPGGNVHYERFAKEVLPNLHSKQSISYRPFNCKKMDFDAMKNIPPAQFMIIEGAYSHHPYFGDFLDLKIFSDVTPDLQMGRLTKRNGEQMAEVFKNKWIPMEEKYFKKYKIKENSCLLV